MICGLEKAKNARKGRFWLGLFSNLFFYFWASAFPNILNIFVPQTGQTP